MKNTSSFLLFGYDHCFPTEVAFLTPQPIEYTNIVLLLDYQVHSLLSARELAALNIETVSEAL